MTMKLTPKQKKLNKVQRLRWKNLEEAKKTTKIVTIDLNKEEDIQEFIKQAVKESTEFQQSINHRIAQTDTLLIEKGKEYVRGVVSNRYHNFDRVAEMNREKPTRSLHGMLSKHLVSYLDMLDDIDRGTKIPLTKVEEKFGDIIVYFHLQEALIKSRFAIKS